MYWTIKIINSWCVKRKKSVIMQLTNRRLEIFQSDLRLFLSFVTFFWYIHKSSFAIDASFTFSLRVCSALCINRSTSSPYRVSGSLDFTTTDFPSRLFCCSAAAFHFDSAALYFVPHALQQRCGSWWFGKATLRRVHESQNTPPQSRQWC